MKWFKRNETTVYAKDGKVVYEVKSVRSRTWPMICWVVVTRNGTTISEKDYVIHYAPIFTPPLTKEELAENEDRHRRMKADGKDYAEKYAKGLIKRPKEKAVVFDMKAYLKAAYKERPEEKPRTIVARSTNAVETEVYSGPPPEERETASLQRMVAVAGSCPIRLRDAKFSSVLSWIDKVRDHYEVRKQYPIVSCLLRMIHDELDTPERRLKAGRRLLAILRPEYDKEREQASLMIAKSLDLEPKEVKEEPKPVKKAPAQKDAWGYRTTSEAAKINAVLDETLKTAAQIKKQAGVVRAAWSHLKTLVRTKKVKLVGDKYRLRKGVTPAKK